MQHLEQIFRAHMHHCHVLNKSFKLTDLCSSAPVWLWDILAKPNTNHPHPKHRCTTRRCLLRLQTCLWLLHHRWVWYDPAVPDLIRDKDESAYREEMDHIVLWWEENNLLLSNNITQEIIKYILLPTQSYKLPGSRKCDQLPILGDPSLNHIKWTNSS